MFTVQHSAATCTISIAARIRIASAPIAGTGIGIMHATKPLSGASVPKVTCVILILQVYDRCQHCKSTFSIDLRGFDGAIQCPRIEININGIFYPLTAGNLADFPQGSTCTGSFSSLAVTPNGYITTGSFSPASAQARITINNVNTTSVTVSTNDGNGTTFSNPFNYTTIPLKLESFNGMSNNCKTVINWKTGIEYNVRNIEIESSIDGITFSKIGELKPKGSDSQYSFVTFHQMNAYFRLKINDIDGYFEYSETIYIRPLCNDLSYSIIPNPASGEIQIKGLKNSDYLLINDMLGKILMKFDAPANNKLNIQSLPHGFYILQVFNARNRVASLKLIRN